MKNFYFGQKVWCWWFNAWYFSAPKCATIICKLPYKGSYYPYSKGYKEQFWLVKVRNGFIVAIPEGCIEDLREKTERENQYRNSRPLDKEQARAWDDLKRWNDEGIEFLNR